MSAALLELDRVEAWYGSVKALHGVSLTVGEGELVIVAHALDERAQVLDLLVTEAARRLVEEQQPRRGRKRTRELDALLRPVRQPGGGPVPQRMEVDVEEDVFRRLVPVPRMCADPDVVQD